MSWLNFNESLNSLKGQLSNLASGVLADGVVNTEKSFDQDVDEVSNLHERFTNVELLGSSNVVQPEPPDSWSWDSPKEVSSNNSSKDDIICNLQKKITVLENEKRELTISLEQLDSDCQQTTDKLVTLKDNLQLEYDELKSDFEKFQKEYTLVLNENMALTKEIQILKTAKENDEVKKLHEENHMLNKQLMISLKEIESKNELTEKLQELQKQYDDHVQSLISEKLINEELQKLYNNLEDVNASLTKKLEKYAELESKELVQEYDEISLQTTNLAVQQKSLIHENEELLAANNLLKNEITCLNKDYKNCISQLNELQDELKKTQHLYDSQKRSSEELVQKIEDDASNIMILQQENEKIKNECKQLRNDIHQMNCNMIRLKDDRDKSSAEYNNLKTLNDKLTSDYQNLKDSYMDLEKTVNSFEASLQNYNYQSMHEKYTNIISENIQKIVDPNDLSSTSTCTLVKEDPLVAEFAQKVDTLLRVLLDFKGKSEALEKEFCEVAQQRNNIVAEKNFEIEKLLKNSEILSQEVISKTQSLKDVEDECAELMKNNDLLITELESYRKSSNLQTISESNEDNMLFLESQLENANKRIQELEGDLENFKQDHIELTQVKKHLKITGQGLSQNKDECTELVHYFKQLEEDKQLLKSSLDKMKADFENIEYKYTELVINFEALKEENEHLKNKLSNIDVDYSNLGSLNDTLEKKVVNLLETEKEVKQKLEFEIESNKEKELQIRNLTERLQNSKMSETSWKLQVDTLSKELQTVTDAKQNLELKFELSMKAFENDKQEYIKQTTEHFVTKMTELEEQVKQLTLSRDDLINLVRSKHEENVRYHDEIQRLNQHLSLEIEKATMLEKQLNELSVEPAELSSEEIAQKNREIENLKDQSNFLKEKCEILAQNLLQEQSSVQKVLQERQAAIDREALSLKELERLREHLVEIEEAYTQELLQAEQKNKEMQMKVNELEQREKDSSSIYTSANIRANQQVETLQAQLQLVTSQRDELRTVISDLEDKENKHVAALTNLQFVLEQFQRDKEKDVEQETERIRRQIGVEKRIQEELRNEIAGLKLQLEESKQGLQAASRLSDQLEKSKQQITNLKDEILKLQEQLQNTEKKYKEVTSSTDMKVDKTLIKNLVLGYITSNSNDQRQILKIIATVLDFNQKESEKANLNKPQQGGWLSTILHPQHLQPNQNVNQQSLSEAFVRFLENESKPKVVPNLLMATQQSKENSGNDKPRQSPHTLSEVVLPTFEDFANSRSSSSILKGVLKNNS